MSSHTLFFRRLALTSYLALLGWSFIWHFILSQPQVHSTLFLLLFWILPLLLPAKGMIQGSPYTHAWANFIVMLYLLHGLTAVYASEGEHWYAAVEILAASCMFIGCSFYARLRGRELGLGLKKLKDEQQ
ncbi:DUF2069 domain-containing protein [Neptunicella sp. SCSIO 80796]|uniref:DUF2069 domain-containing protein n=1 Tax=Neptunicella plasticusilytica TaxID=3117012 RepID=UPI003A4DF0D8